MSVIKAIIITLVVFGFLITTGIIIASVALSKSTKNGETLSSSDGASGIDGKPGSDVGQNTTWSTTLIWNELGEIVMNFDTIPEQILFPRLISVVWPIPTVSSTIGTGTQPFEINKGQAGKSSFSVRFRQNGFFKFHVSAFLSTPDSFDVDSFQFWLTDVDTGQRKVILSEDKNVSTNFINNFIVKPVDDNMKLNTLYSISLTGKGETVARRANCFNASFQIEYMGENNPLEDLQNA
jgi:hypothetical protein